MCWKCLQNSAERQGTPSQGSSSVCLAKGQTLLLVQYWRGMGSGRTVSVSQILQPGQRWRSDRTESCLRTHSDDQEDPPEKGLLYWVFTEDSSLDSTKEHSSGRRVTGAYASNWQQGTYAVQWEGGKVGWILHSLGTDQWMYWVILNVSVCIGHLSSSLGQKSFTKQLKEGGRLYLWLTVLGDSGHTCLALSLKRSLQPQKFIMKDLCHGGREAERGGDYRKNARKIQPMGTQPCDSLPPIIP